MGFTEELTTFSERVKLLKNQISTEEATKMSLIVPFFQILGYDVFNPAEFCPEFNADIGIKKGEKVDYAIIISGRPVILIEAKVINAKLEKHSSQLFRYFSATNAKFAILTNGLTYKFYTDLAEKNKMDKEPFYEFNILNLSEDDIKEISKYIKTNFNEGEAFNSASVLKYANLFKEEIQKQFNNPSDDFVRFFLKDIYLGVKTQSVIDKFKPVLKKTLNDYLDEVTKEKMTSIINESGYIGTNTGSTSLERRDVLSSIEEESFEIIKSFLHPLINTEDLSYKKTETYFTILFKNNSRKWLTRLYINSSGQITLGISSDKSEKKYKLNTIQEIENYKEDIIIALQSYIQPKPAAEYIYTKWGKYVCPEPYKVNFTRGSWNK